jgi:hypothetical protein
MRIALIVGLLALWVGPETCLGQERKVLFPEQVEDDRPKGEVTVAFRVVEVTLLDGPIQGGQPHQPISLRAAGWLKAVRSKLCVVLVGKALTQVHHLGINDPVKYFFGRTVEATGKFRYT